VKVTAYSRFLIPASGAVLAILCGLLLWGTRLGDGWINASYDSLFRFSNHPVTNNVVLVLMDNAAFDQFQQSRSQPWDRGLHAKLLDRLADDDCSVVAFDSFFHELRDPATDDRFAAALRRPRRVVLMAEISEITHPNLTGVTPNLPNRKFLSAAGNYWGVAWLTPDLDGVVRHHWPLVSPGSFPSLPWTMAAVAGAKLDPQPRERWLRYYAPENPWPTMSYGFALSEPANYFRHKIVLVATQPATSLPNGEPDKFSTPYTHWSGEATGGAEILLTAALNLINGDWLERPAAFLEVVIFGLCGLALGMGLWRLRPGWMIVAALAAVVLVTLSGILLGHYTHYWFPWLIVAGAQLPVVLVWNATWKFYYSSRTGAVKAPLESMPVIPGYKIFEPALGEGAYGKVWLAKNKKGEWRALKVIFQSRFGEDTRPYEREFNGISRYQPVSAQHPGLLRVDYLSPSRDGFFFYAMELGDSLVEGWMKEPSRYKLHDLVSTRAELPSRRLPVDECVRIGIVLAEALDFLHQQGLTHRDIKPQNIIFVNDRPKLADPGLVAEIRPLAEMNTYVGTPGFMPPPPEMPGTVAADVYGLGMVLFVAATGKPAAFFPDLATSLVAEELVAGSASVTFMQLNRIILKACQPEASQRYATAADLLTALKRLAGA
jgi:CHASE2 domain-containing sensor protein